jgi:hypothetical protein
MDQEKEFEEGLIDLMYALGISKVRMMLSLALIRAHHLHKEMARWIVSYKGKEDTLTAQAFMSKLKKLTDDNND